MTDLVIVCTGRKTHPEAVAIASDLRPADPLPDGWPSLHDRLDAMREDGWAALHTPRRKRGPGGVRVFTCPACGRNARLGERTLGRMISVEFALQDAAKDGAPLPAKIPLDLSFI